MKTSKIEVIMADGSQTPPAVSRAVESRIADMNTPTLNHTPGPWSAVLDPCPTTKNRWIVEKRTGGWKTFIAEVHGDPEHTGGPDWQGTKEANARLIASAPDLLAENRRLRKAIKGLLRHCVTVDGMPDSGKGRSLAMKE